MRSKNDYILNSTTPSSCKIPAHLSWNQLTWA
uniref:Uncharacterized protein n=1 Tax=Rhizophora mucronata TaxID=61149 RepID=A0A2P2PC51_RHIMU